MALFGSVMDVVDQFLPDKEKHAPVRSMLSFLAVNSTYLGPYYAGQRAVSGLRLGLAGRRPRCPRSRGIGHDVRALRGSSSEHGGELRRHAKVAKIVVTGRPCPGCRVWATERSITAPVVVSNLDPTATFTQLVDPSDLPEAFVRRVRGDRSSSRLLPDALRTQRACPSTRAPTRDLNGGAARSERDILRDGRADAARLRGLRPWAGARVAIVQLAYPDARRPEPGPAGQACRQQLRLLLPDRHRSEEAGSAARRDGGAHGGQDRQAAPNFPDLIERQLNYPAYTYELMFGCTGGDFTHGLLQPEFMGPFRPGPKGWPDNPIPIDGLYLCGAGCHGGPGVTFIPGYNCGYAVLDDTHAPGCSGAGAR